MEEQTDYLEKVILDGAKIAKLRKQLGYGNSETFAEQFEVFHEVDGEEYSFFLENKEKYKRQLSILEENHPRTFNNDIEIMFPKIRGEMCVSHKTLSDIESKGNKFWRGGAIPSHSLITTAKAIAAMLKLDDYKELVISQKDISKHLEAQPDEAAVDIVSPNKNDLTSKIRSNFDSTISLQANKDYIEIRIAKDFDRFKLEIESGGEKQYLDYNRNTVRGVKDSEEELVSLLNYKTLGFPSKLKIETIIFLGNFFGVPVSRLLAYGSQERDIVEKIERTY